MPIGEPFVQLDAIDSTNNYAMAKVQAQLAEHGTVWFAHRQTAGKGQRGKAWDSGQSENIILSVAIEPHGLLLNQQFVLSAMVAIACYDLFSKYAKSETKIKWPNDIYWEDRKAGGILIENQVKGQNWTYAVAGIGLNINQVNFAEQAGRAVSLKQVTGVNYDIIVLAKELCVNLEQRFAQVKGGDTAALLQEYETHLYKLNEQVTFKKDNALFTARVTGVSNTGELLINMGEPDKISVGQVEWMIT